MTSGNAENILLKHVLEALNTKGEDGMKYLLQIVLNSLMKTERDIALNAAPYERCDERKGYANGFKDKALDTRMGRLELKIQQTRGIIFYPGCLEK